MRAEVNRNIKIKINRYKNLLCLLVNQNGMFSQSRSEFSYAWLRQVTLLLLLRFPLRIPPYFFRIN